MRQGVGGVMNGMDLILGVEKRKKLPKATNQYIFTLKTTTLMLSKRWKSFNI
jgi:hypothetical protein